MRRIFVILLPCILYCCILYGAEEGKEIKGHPTPEELQRAQQQSRQQQRPILPPIVPQGSPMVSPTPYITVPQIQPQVINPITQVNTPHVPNSPTMQNIPSMPTYAVPPAVPISTEIPQVPVIGNTIGKVTNLGSEKDGSLWMEVNDNLFGESVRVKIRNLKNTPIVKEAKIYSFKDIKIGDTVNAMFHTEGEDSVANFITVMTEEEIEMWNQQPDTDPTITPQENNPQPQEQ